MSESTAQYLLPGRRTWTVSRPETSLEDHPARIRYAHPGMERGSVSSEAFPRSASEPWAQDSGAPQLSHAQQAETCPSPIQVRIGQKLGAREHGAGRHARLLKRIHQLVVIVLQRPGLDKLVELVLVRPPAVRGGKPLVAGLQSGSPITPQRARHSSSDETEMLIQRSSPLHW